MAVTDEINKIKREGNPYDEGLQGDSPPIDYYNLPKGSFEDLIPTIRDTKQETIYGDRRYIGDTQFRGFGDSQYDERFTTTGTLDDRSLEDLRAERQPWYDQFSNNLLNMGTIATTTFADSFLGTAAGLINMVFNPYDSGSSLNYLEQAGNKFVNNPVSLYLNSINKSVKENTPTYKSDEYMANQQNGEWWKNMGSSQFWGETIMENAGFTLGMVGSGKVAGSLLNKMSGLAEQSNIIKRGINTAIKEGRITGNADDIYKKILTGKQPLTGIDLDGSLSAAAKALQKAGPVNSALATGIAVTGEARMEGVHNSQEYKDTLLSNLDSPEGTQELKERTLLSMRADPKYDHMFAENADGMPTNQLRPEYAEQFNNIVEENRQKAIIEIDNAAARVAGWDFALNFPILYGSSLWQFGRTFAGGFNTQKGFTNNIKAAFMGNQRGLAKEGAERIIKQGDKYVVKGSVKPYLKAASMPVVEANEEMLQRAAGDASMRIAGSEMNSFVGYKLDPKSEQESIGNLNQIMNSIINTYSDPASYEEGFAGLIMGGTGSLNFTMSKNAKTGKRRLFDGGVYGEIQNARSEEQDLQAVTEALNKRLQDPTFKSYYQGLIRHDALERNKQNSLEDNDKFSFKNADHAQLISDIIMFEKAGKLQDLYDNINGNIKAYSTNDPKEISDIATELRELGKNKETGVDIYKDKTDEELVQSTLKFNQELKDSVDKYRQISSDLTSIIGDKFENNELEEMTYYFSQIQNFEDRYEDLHKNLVNTLNKVKSRGLAQKKFDISLNNQMVSLSLQEIIAQATPSELKDFILKNEEIAKYIDKQDQKDLSFLLNKSLNSVRKETIDKYTKLFSEFTPLANVIATDLVDLASIEYSRSNLVNTYNKYIGQPHLLINKIREEEVKAEKEQEKIVAQTVVDKIKGATSLQDVERIINEERNGSNANKLSDLIQEASISDNPAYNEFAAEYSRVLKVLEQADLSKAKRDFYGGREMADNLEDNFLFNKTVQLLHDKMMSGGTTLVGLNPDNYTEEDLNTLTHNDGSPLSQNEKDKVLTLINSVLNELNTSNLFIQGLYTRPSPTAPTAKVKKSPENLAPSGATKVEDPVKPIGNITSQEAKDENKAIGGIIDRANTGTKDSWNNGTHEINVTLYKTTDEIYPNNEPTFKRAVDYLTSKGAFDFINNGNMKRGQKVAIKASQEYWDYLKENATQEQIDWVDNNKPLLLVVDNNGIEQIVGTFTTALNPAVHEAVLKGETVTTTVSKIYPGRLGFTRTENPLSTILSGNKPDGSELEWALGIIMDTGQMSTNLGIMAIPPNTPVDQTKGRVYLMVQGANGVYIPAAVRVKNIGEVDLNATNELFSSVKRAINHLARESFLHNDAALGNAVQELRNLLYVGKNSRAPIHLRSIPEGEFTQYHLQIGERHINIGTVDMEGNKTLPDIAQVETEIIEVLKSLNVPFQVSQKNINTGNYNQRLIDAGILTSNVQFPYVKGAMFEMNPIDNNLKPVTAPSNTPKAPDPASKTPVNNTEVTNGKTVEMNAGTYTLTPEGNVFNPKGNLVQDPDTVTAVKAKNYLDGMSEAERNKIRVLGNEAFPNTVIANRVFYRFHDGRVYSEAADMVWDSNNALAQKVNDVYNKRNSSNSTKNKPTPVYSPFELRFLKSLLYISSSRNFSAGHGYRTDFYTEEDEELDPQTMIGTGHYYTKGGKPIDPKRTFEEAADEVEKLYRKEAEDKGYDFDSPLILRLKDSINSVYYDKFSKSYEGYYYKGVPVKNSEGIYKYQDMKGITKDHKVQALQYIYELFVREINSLKESSSTLANNTPKEIPAPEPTPTPKRAIKGRMVRSALDDMLDETKDTSETVKEMIQQNKEYQEENCNETFTPSQVKANTKFTL